MNMSYCRFHNTRLDMSECLEALNNGDAMSDEELLACKDMFSEIYEFLSSEGVEIDEDSFAEWFETLDHYRE